MGRIIGKESLVLSKQTFWLSLLLMLPLTFSIYALGIPLTHLYTTDSLAVEASVLVTLFSLLGTPMTIGTSHLYSSLAGFGQCSASLLCDKYRNVVYPHWNRISDGDLCLVGVCPVFGPEPFWIMVFVGYFYVTVTSAI